MRFINPSFLWALPLGLIPIIIYYLMRYRSLKVVWGANYVLERALERLKKKVYIEQLILLALRVLACVALVVAFARPALKSRAALVSGSGVNHVVILDGSYSMLAGEQNARRWDQATTALKQLTATWGRGEAWSLLLMEEDPRWVVESAPMTTAKEAAAIIDALAPGESAASLSRAFDAVRDRFPSDELEIYVFADDQASTWQGMEKVGWPRNRSAAVYWVNPPLPDRGNLAVTAVRPAGDRGLLGHPSRAFVSVRNFGAEPVKDAPVELLLDGAFFARQAVSLLPGQERWLHFDVAFETPGPHYLTARLGRDALDFDNRLSAGIEVADRLSVLVLRDRGRTGKFDSAWEFLQIAGRIEQMTDEDGARMFTMGPLLFSLGEDECTPEALREHDVVLLDGGRTLTPQLASGLQAYVAGSGGLMIAADELIDKTAWNELLGRHGLLPAPLGNLRVEALGGEEFQTLSRAQFGGPALRAFETDEDGDIANARFYSWYELGDAAASATVLASFGDRTPYALSKRMEPGCVVLLAAGLNGRGSNLVVREFYLPLLFRLFAEASAGGVYPRTVAKGQPIRLRLRSAASVRAVTFNAEGRDAVPLALERSDGEAVARAPAELSATGLCSLLVLREGGAERVWFGVQGPRVDSDLSPVTEESKKTVRKALGLAEARNWEQLDELLKSSRRGREWHHWVLVALLALLFGEMLMQRRFI